jgi:hypothetical protein
MHRYLFALFIVLGALPGIGRAAQSGAPASPPERDVQSWCASVTRVIPQIKLKTCMAAALTPVTTRSVMGRSIMLREFRAAQRNAPLVLIIGGIHGDELTAVSIVFRWLELLQQPGYDGPPLHWRVVPLLNPDGLLAKPPSRVNARGVDLNRNFPTDNWSRDAPRYWHEATRRDPRRFPGAVPASEPESRWLHDEITRFKPDVIVSVHAPFDVLDFDGPPKGVEVPARFGRLRLKRVGVYPGSLGNFGGIKEGIPVVTLELPHALEMPTEQELSDVWRDMQEWLRVNLIERRARSASNDAGRLASSYR